VIKKIFLQTFIVFMFFLPNHASAESVEYNQPSSEPSYAPPDFSKEAGRYIQEAKIPESQHTWRSSLGVSRIGVSQISFETESGDYSISPAESLYMVNLSLNKRLAKLKDGLILLGAQLSYANFTDDALVRKDGGDNSIEPVTYTLVPLEIGVGYEYNLKKLLAVSWLNTETALGVGRLMIFQNGVSEQSEGMKGTNFVYYQLGIRGYFSKSLSAAVSYRGFHGLGHRKNVIFSTGPTLDMALGI